MLTRIILTRYENELEKITQGFLSEGSLNGKTMVCYCRKRHTISKGSFLEEAKENLHDGKGLCNYVEPLTNLKLEEKARGVVQFTHVYTATSKWFLKLNKCSCLLRFYLALHSMLGAWLALSHLILASALSTLISLILYWREVNH